MYEYYVVTFSDKVWPWKCNNSFPLIVVVMDIAGNNIKWFRFATKMQCCQATKYYVHLLTITRIKYYECLFLPQ